MRRWIAEASRDISYEQSKQRVKGRLRAFRLDKDRSGKHESKGAGPSQAVYVQRGEHLECLYRLLLLPGSSSRPLLSPMHPCTVLAAHTGHLHLHLRPAQPNTRGGRHRDLTLRERMPQILEEQTRTPLAGGRPPHQEIEDYRLKPSTWPLGLAVELRAVLGYMRRTLATGEIKGAWTMSAGDAGYGRFGEACGGRWAGWGGKDEPSAAKLDAGSRGTWDPRLGAMLGSRKGEVRWNAYAPRGGNPRPP
ncbi:hypothetical protein C8R45DRAFT_974196 [Mycena sanguinolenta]|nr:hypothetical protein C8R45DRAFT_974196 [Mycena sanguinolenta]